MSVCMYVCNILTPLPSLSLLLHPDAYRFYTCFIGPLRILKLNGIPLTYKSYFFVSLLKNPVIPQKKRIETQIKEQFFSKTNKNEQIMP